MPHQPASAALSHIRVLDLTRVRSGPTAVRQLGDWGADVIKIEQPASLEADGALGAGRNTADWQNLQRNKRSLTLNLKDPGQGDFPETGGDGRRCGREFPPRCERPAGHWL